MADRAYTLDNPQTLEEFLAKYAGALDSQGRFIDGRANLNYDGMSAADVYKAEMGGYTIPGFSDGYTMDTGPGAGTFVDPKASVNADWIEDPRAKGWIGQHPGGTKMLAAIGAMVGGGSLLGAEAGTAGGSAAAGGSSAFGGAGSITGANVLGAGDLALTAMPQVTASSLGLTGAQALGAGAAGGAGAASGLLGAPGMTMPNLVGAGDLALTSMPQVTASALGMPTGLASTLGSVGSAIKNGVQGLNDLTGGNLGAIAGGLLGAAASGDTTTSTNRDPWGPAQGYLKDNLATNANMQKHYQANPFSAEQQSAYQGLLNTNANNQANAPIMQANANSFMQSKRGAMPQMQGLLSGTQAAPIDWSKYANIGKG